MATVGFKGLSKCETKTGWSIMTKNLHSFKLSQKCAIFGNTSIY